MSALEFGTWEFVLSAECLVLSAECLVPGAGNQKVGNRNFELCAKCRVPGIWNPEPGTSYLFIPKNLYSCIPNLYAAEFYFRSLK